MNNQEEKWSSLDETAEHVGVSKDTVRNWIKKGNIPAHRVVNNKVDEVSVKKLTKDNPTMQAKFDALNS